MRRLVIAMGLSLLAGVAQADETWYVNTASTSGGNGTTNATTGDNRAYATLAACSAAKAGSLTGRGVVTIYVCGTTDSSVVNLSDWTNATETEHLHIICSNPHSGVRDSSKYRLVVSASYANAIANMPAYTYVYGVQATASGTNSNGFHSTGVGVVIERCLAVNCGGSGFFDYSGNAKYVNCGAFSNTKSGFITGASSGMALYQCVAANNGNYGVYDAATYAGTTLTNCYAGGNTTADYASTGTYTVTTCYSADGTLSTTDIDFTTDDFVSVTDGSEDLHLVDGSSLLSVGTSLSDALDPDVDVDGESRPMGSGWDIGYDEYTESDKPASTASPATEAVHVARGVVLGWSAGVGAASHNVYFGTDPTPDADSGSSEFIGNQAGTTYDPAGLLEYGTTYYWRVDEVQADETVVTGYVWSFTVIDPTTRYASVDGTGDGLSAGSPKALGTLDWINPGDTIVLLDGNYGSFTLGINGYPDDHTKLQANSDLGAVFTQITMPTNYITVHGLKIETTTGQGANISGSGNTVEYCEVVGAVSDVDGHYLSQSEGIFVSAGTGNLVQHNEVHRMFIGIQVSGGTATVSRNHVHSISSSHIRIFSADGVVVEYNHVHNHDNSKSYTPDPHGSGIAIKAENCIIRGNLIYNGSTSRPLFLYGSQPGYMSNGYKNVIIENNIVLAGKTSDYTESSTFNEYADLVDVGEGCRIRNNTFGSGCKIYLTPPSTTTPGKDVVIANNIARGGMMINPWWDIGDDDSDGTPNYQEWSQATVMAMLATCVTNGMVEAGNIVTNLTTVYGGFAHSIAWSDLWATPTSYSNASDSFWALGTMFDCVSGRCPYTLAAGSVAINAGSATYQSTTDFFGNARGSAPDVGAYEYGTGTLPAAISSFTPADASTEVSRSSGLSWTLASGAVGYDVYWGMTKTLGADDYQSYESAGYVPYPSESVPLADLTGGSQLIGQTTYYYRIDVVGDTAVRRGSTLSFTTGVGSSIRPTRINGWLNGWLNGGMQ